MEKSLFLYAYVYEIFSIKEMHLFFTFLNYKSFVCISVMDTNTSKDIL